MNKQIAGTPLEGKSLEEVVLASWNGGNPTPVFNNAAQVWNHTFFWESMAPKAGGAPSGKLADAITKSFGSLDEFKVGGGGRGASEGDWERTGAVAQTVLRGRRARGACADRR